MYDVIKTEELDWPSLTVQWMPGVEHPPTGKFTIQRLLMGTQTSGQEPEFLLVADVHVPAVESDEEDDDLSDTPAKGKVHEEALPPEEMCIGRFRTKLRHDREVHRARYMPQSPDMVATKSSTGAVYLFDVAKDAPSSSTTSAHQVAMAGTAGEGYALAWNAQREGLLLSGDSALCCWDVSGGSHDTLLQPFLRNPHCHDDVIEDVEWISGDAFATVSDDNTLRTWDLREATKATAMVHYSSHLNALGYTTAAEHRLLTGAADGSVLQWDLRKLTGGAVHTFKGHRDEVFSIQCAPFHPSIFASAGYDRGVYVWDIDRIGAARDSDEEDGDGDGDDEVPPELVFQHGGHTSRVLDISWNPNPEEAWVMASIQEQGNLLHIWKPSQELLEEDNGDEGFEAKRHSDGHDTPEPPVKRPRV
eukprot:GGOE01061961.1.p1 GENE.GGOE01061961.1~~GGOE01061961.1.p1  ORF type:complete len:491 (+),score=147.71 GGOE01061961.1:220-1473(+)